jgi:hypothetical protein
MYTSWSSQQHLSGLWPPHCGTVARIRLARASAQLLHSCTVAFSSLREQELHRCVDRLAFCKRFSHLRRKERGLRGGAVRDRPRRRQPLTFPTFPQRIPCRPHLILRKSHRHEHLEAGRCICVQTPALRSDAAKHHRRARQTPAAHAHTPLRTHAPTQTPPPAVAEA